MSLLDCPRSGGWPCATLTNAVRIPCAGVTFSPLAATGPQGVLQFTKLNIQIINSQFTNLLGTPYNLVFNDSTVEFVNTVFQSNTGADPADREPARNAWAAQMESNARLT